MEHNYLLNPAIQILYDAVLDPHSKEKDVQSLHDNLLWTVFPASDNWCNLSRYQDGTEPDNKVMRLVLFHAGYAPIDHTYVELKRWREDNSMPVFNRVAADLLVDHMRQSQNWTGSTLYGYVGIGVHIVFYKVVIPPNSNDTYDLVIEQQRPYDIIVDALLIQQRFNYTKANIPRDPNTPSAAPAQASEDTSSSSNVSAAEPQDGFPPIYYYIEHRQTYLNNNGHITRVEGRPLNEWVYHAEGWRETGRQKHWRKVDEHNRGTFK